MINIVSEESEGTSIGLLSFDRGGHNNVNVQSRETGFINGGFRIGAEQIYNIISIDYNAFHGENLWQVGIGIGYYWQLDQRGNGIETDLMYYHVKSRWKVDNRHEQSYPMAY